MYVKDSLLSDLIYSSKSYNVLLKSGIVILKASYAPNSNILFAKSELFTYPKAT